MPEKMTTGPYNEQTSGKNVLDAAANSIKAAEI